MQTAIGSLRQQVWAGTFLVVSVLSVAVISFYIIIGATTEPHRNAGDYPISVSTDLRPTRTPTTPVTASPAEGPTAAAPRTSEAPTSSVPVASPGASNAPISGQSTAGLPPEHAAVPAPPATSAPTDLSAQPTQAPVPSLTPAPVPPSQGPHLPEPTLAPRPDPVEPTHLPTPTSTGLPTVSPPRATGHPTHSPPRPPGTPPLPSTPPTETPAPQRPLLTQEALAASFRCVRTSDSHHLTVSLDVSRYDVRSATVTLIWDGGHIVLTAVQGRLSVGSVPASEGELACEATAVNADGTAVSTVVMVPSSGALPTAEPSLTSTPSAPPVIS